jgi:hypothetical protein
MKKYIAENQWEDKRRVEIENTRDGLGLKK